MAKEAVPAIFPTDSLRLRAGCSPDNFRHLYQTCRPANLSERFEQVDIEAILSVALSSQTLPIHLHMKGPISYVGGKNRIAQQIIEIFPKHKTYVEVFAGGAQVLFHKEPSPVEVLNDLDGDVVTFFRVCQSHYEELIRYLKFTLVSREWFDLLQEQDPKYLTDIQRAARFFYLQKNAYGGLVRNRAFGYAVEEPSRFNPERLAALIEDSHKRLVRVQIENLPYEDILKRYDRPRTLFYLDPPYWGRKLYRFPPPKVRDENLAVAAACVPLKSIVEVDSLQEARSEETRG
jgi:DNA adenine methylase